MKVYFVRHGRTHGNTLQVHQDHTDELNELGLKQAKAVAKRFKTIDIDIIFSSDYIRAMVTAEEIAKVTNKKIEVTELLRERRRPSSLVGKRYDSEEVVRVMDEMESRSNDADWHYTDEENHVEALQRAQKMLRFLEARTEENILVVTHAAYMRFLLTAMVFGTDATVEQFHKMYDAFNVHNTGVTLCEFKEGLRGMHKKELYWHIMTWNDYAHLGEIEK